MPPVSEAPGCPAPQFRFLAGPVDTAFSVKDMLAQAKGTYCLRGFYLGQCSEDLCIMLSF